LRGKWRAAWIALVGVLLSLAVGAAAAVQDSAGHFINLNDWPLDADFRFVLAYPDTPWTWQYLGLNPARGCPPYRLRTRDQSAAYWRDPGTPEDADWQQASRGAGLVSCYHTHAGTDIPATPGAPVVAAADGTVALIEPSSDTEGEGAMIVVDHHRTVAGVDYTWRVRYIHLTDEFPVRSGPVREGQVIGFVLNQGLNTHLHFEVQDMLQCQDRCIINPWGPVYLWVDDDGDGWPDSASAVLAAAPPGANLVTNGDFSAGLDSWLAAPGATPSVRDGALVLGRPAGSSIQAAVRQFIPVAAPPGAAFEISLRLGNSGGAARFASVTLSGVRLPTATIGCLFTLPPGAPLAAYTIRGRSQSRWANLVLTISANPALDPAGVMAAGVSLRYLPGLDVARTRCISPGE
jgi:murein DD-endopeptidase MepM/ murein hydrolase activator NlpD